MHAPFAVGMPIEGRPGYVRRAPAIAFPLSNERGGSVARLPINQQHWAPILLTLCDLYNGMNFSFQKIVSQNTRSLRNSSAIEAQARRIARKVRLQARKSRWRQGPVDNYGEFRLIDPDRNLVVAGERYDLSPAEVIEYCTA